MIELSVVIPAFEEEKRLPRTLREAYAWLAAHEPRHEILVVDDGSRDRTAEVVKALQAEIPTLRLHAFAQNEGKGAAVRAGMRQAQGKYRLFMDADHSTHICEWTKAKALLLRDADVAIASRRHPESVLAVRQPRWRELLGQGFNLCVRMLAGVSFADTQCGFKAFRAEAADAIFSRLISRGFGFDVEALWLAERLGFRIAEFPVRWVNDPASKVKVARDAWRVLAELARAISEHRKRGEI